MSFWGFPLGWETPPTQKIKLEYNSYYSESSYLSLWVKQLYVSVCIKMYAVKMLLKLLYMVSEDFFKVLYLILFW